MKVAACLMLKNESAVIRRCLDSINKLVDKIIVIDTGSTDNTLDIVREYGEKVQIFERPWVNFGHNRTEAVGIAKDHGDYVLVVDADQTVEGTFPDDNADGYRVRLRHGSIIYRLPLLLKSTKEWIYEGATHEALICPADYSMTECDSIVTTEHADSSRRQGGKKLLDDAQLLEKDLARKPDDPRVVFYLARTYDDLASITPNKRLKNKYRQKSIQHYTARLSLEGYTDEIFYSKYRLGAMCIEKGNGLAILMDAWQQLPRRWEPVYEACRWLNSRNLHRASYALSSAIVNLPPVKPEGLFIQGEVYEYLLLFEHSISSYYVNRYAESLEACNKLLHRDLPEKFRDKVIENSIFPAKKLTEDAKLSIVR